ncbi:MAG: GNAT family N-acetyltransferase [Chloroflexota bacterium]|nr:GNAT family N-acetyltransferase [Anaerolineales bacterium]
MKDITTRIYKGEKDIEIMANLIARIRPHEFLNDHPAQVNLEEDLAAEQVRANTRLWFDREQPVGWAYVDAYDNLWWEIERAYEEALGSQIIEWGESCVRKAHRSGESATLDTNCREDHPTRIAFLKRHGFQQTETTTVTMERDLSQPIPEPRVPPGFMIRPLAGAHEAEAVAEVHRAAFVSDYMTTKNRLALMSTSEYDLSLDLIVVAPDGTMSANCICSVNEQEKIGYTDPVATHPDYQGMGLGRALLSRGMQLLRERGMLSARFGTSGDNLAMQKTGASVGFKVEHKKIWFSKQTG